MPPISREPVSPFVSVTGPWPGSVMFQRAGAGCARVASCFVPAAGVLSLAPTNWVPATSAQQLASAAMSRTRRTLEQTAQQLGGSEQHTHAGANGGEHKHQANAQQAILPPAAWNAHVVGHRLQLAH